MAKTLIILGSARGDGNTAKAALQLEAETGGKLVDLLDYRIAPYDYGNNYPEDDDFIAMAKRLIIYDRIIFASPVYWYSMSGLLKDFFDRLTDLLTYHKDLGRRLRGKEMGVLSCSAERHVNAGFYEPFRLSADYLGMTYGPERHAWVRGSRVEMQLVNG
ncbi:NADPH-dependent FMN reductase [Neolewinella xylanilytica]|uniref:NADPH-dependent FMN reductase n=1 Tax=Neolewinella xylanilytica TaxID=1514080 RepID=A0A2S6I3A6_9BACT|nr:NAD(P)H-dependent oxidoreductase [Neolewinella xylanilytica]PPK85657.1 NADPH-dependent FMN reductase [Neolewinella xylanilytica]